MRDIIRFLALPILGMALSTPAHAEQYLAGGIGWFNFTDSGHHSSSSNISGEWRGNPFYYGFLPVIGASINTDGGAYGYAGLNYDWEFTPNWFLTPGIDIGAYAHGSGINLGGPVEFREKLEASYKFNNGYRAGAEISHMSNADIYDRNPGEESLMVVLSVPLGQ